MEQEEVTFGKWLIEKRKHLGVSRKTLADKSGVLHSFLKRWENDEGVGFYNLEPTVSIIKQICHGLVPDNITGDEQEKLYDGLARESLAIAHKDVLSPSEILPYSDFENKLTTIAKTVPPQLREQALELLAGLTSMMGLEAEDFTRYGSEEVLAS